jgi:hypothetical protein
MWGQSTGRLIKDGTRKAGGLSLKPIVIEMQSLLVAN